MMVKGKSENRRRLDLEFGMIGALANGHYVYASVPEGSRYKGHGDIYVDKDLISSYPDQIKEIILQMTLEGLQYSGVDLVVAPASGAIVFGSALAAVGQVQFFYANKEGNNFIFRDSFARRIGGRKVIVAEDVVNSGTTLKKVVAEVERLGGQIVAAVILCLRGNPDLGDLEVDCFVEERLDTEKAEECSLCKRGVAINTDLGHGAEFLREFGEDPTNWPANRNG